jgi:hypothetical protein
MEKKTLHMTMGENVAEMLLDISREHLQNLDIKKAVNVFNGGMGIPNDIAIKIIMGEMKITFDVETQIFEVKENEAGDMWGEMEGKDWAEWKKKDIIDSAVSWHKILCEYLEHVMGLSTSTINMKSSSENLNNIEFMVETDIKSYLNGVIEVETPHKDVLVNAKKSIKELENATGIFTLLGVDSDIHFFNSSDDDANYLHILCLWMCKWKMKTIEDVITELRLITGLYENETFNYRKAKDYLLLGEILSEEQRDTVKQYVKDKISLGERPLYIPIDINEKKYDAYWIDPEGNAYGADGSVALQLHSSMAEAIVDHKKMRKSPNEDFQMILENLGYVKMTGNWVLYNGQKCEIEGDKIIYKTDSYITPQQIKTVCTIIKKWYEGKMLCGYKRGYVHVSTFKQMEPLMMAKLFEL